ncbi:hypothetical protein O181_054720 [Austropuccinia psidii MF-1]|uniref:Integrase zinc-binding domain-containing protein n=1 Tax=Austropuccinia psidii MF-1 TaxID=1389203 RepID=A0A9Q3HUL7_9BASI|nr:hypothetical protein [Austropuccinia psidii MF-1]
MVLFRRMLINIILLECHDNIYCGHISEERAEETIKTCAWWSSWRKYVIEHFNSCDTYQKANTAIGKRFSSMIHIQEPSTLLEVVQIYWVTAFPPGGEQCYNACLVIVDRYSKTPIFLPCHKYDTGMDTALLIWNRVISHTDLFKIPLVRENQNLHQPYGQIVPSFWVQNYHSQQLTIQKLMD